MTGGGGSDRTGGVMTARWGWQPTAWMQEGLPTWRWRGAPAGLVTRRQMRELGLAPGGAQPVGQVVCRSGRRWAWLYDRAELVAKRVPTSAQLVAVAAALAARRWCSRCRRDVGYCVPTSLGECVSCHYPDPADDADLVDDTACGVGWVAHDPVCGDGVGAMSARTVLHVLAAHLVDTVGVVDVLAGVVGQDVGDADHGAGSFWSAISGVGIQIPQPGGTL